MVHRRVADRISVCVVSVKYTIKKQTGSSGNFWLFSIDVSVRYSYPHTWYLIDTIGFMTSILFAEYDDKLSPMDANRLVKLLLFVILAFSCMGIELKGMILGRYMKLITIVYSLSACAIVAIVGR